MIALIIGKERNMQDEQNDKGEEQPVVLAVQDEVTEGGE